MLGQKQPHTRNAGLPFDKEWVGSAQFDEAMVHRAVGQALQTRARSDRDVATSLVQVIRCMDLTTLAGDDTPERVTRLSSVARRPVPVSVLGSLGVDPSEVSAAAVCVYPSLVEEARSALSGSSVRICSVAGGFPAGQIPSKLKAAEIRAAVAAGADEVDVVIRRTNALLDDWSTVFEEVGSFREAAGDATLKVILATGELDGFERIGKVSRICLLAGADFIKTSTGKERINATLEAGAVMAAAIRDYAELCGHQAGLKPAGGIGTAEQALHWIELARQGLGVRTISPENFRIGASSLLDDVVKRLSSLAATSD